MISGKAITIAGSCLLLAACGGDSSSSSDQPTSTSVTLPFEAVYNSDNDPISCDGTLSGLGAGVDATLVDFRFYVHDVVLTTSHQRQVALQLDNDDDGSQDGTVALLDFRDYISCGTEPQEPQTTVTGTVDLNDGESITGLTFTVGVPESLNHGNLTEAETPLNLASMHWSWQAGYKFMRLDVSVAGGDAYNLHLGSTDCSGDAAAGEAVSCERPNRPVIEFADFTPGEDTIVIDYGAIVGTALDGVDDGGAPGCMSGVADPECQAVFESLGLDLTSGEPDAALTQTAFRLK